MRHLHSGRKLGVAPHHRKAMLRSLTLALIEQEGIKTTTARAKELRWFADRVVTLAKRGDLAGRRRIVTLLGSTETKRPGENRVRTAIERVYSDLVPRFKGRTGGYTQILKLAKRRAGDNAELVLMRFIPLLDEKAGGKGAKKAKGDAPAKKAKAHASDKGGKKAEAKKHEDKKSAKAPEDKPAKAKKEDKEE